MKYSSFCTVLKLPWANMPSARKSQASRFESVVQSWTLSVPLKRVPSAQAKWWNTSRLSALPVPLVGQDGRDDIADERAEMPQQLLRAALIPAAYELYDLRLAHISPPFAL